ncbi:uncharacterized protein Z518_04362 [Rhinocladiella mackenziei CBS 650.93]|uniref:Rhinocladiella mackenziei CBS 650.93 unplaced genomic scaffold supercont1.3, whole genome shotgun sequence n=1 Tax=Rhinocladiella mackenziei CBS 650.93 TaxID=1442369 RepID=A0A0D2IT81_9EURO|nr:uncharacterized protein Z518_04362 [Rhinocladiella mackenziei CBS 650.93]KIX06386.1 hypothetical protein Z518_04362 [Rhinocladiella mackenziei CBS 650.93]
MAGLLNSRDLQQCLQSYRAFDEARQSELENLAQMCLRLHTERVTLQSDLDDERDIRRTWKRRAEDAEAVIQRKFVVVLVDGNGYIFQKPFFQALATSGGSRAANYLYAEVINNLKASDGPPAIPPDCDVLVNVYATRAVLAPTLAAAGYLSHPSQIDTFFGSFSQSHSLFQFIDCGPGEKRVDAKLRGIVDPAPRLLVPPLLTMSLDTFRFYAYNAQCQRIFLACSHEDGYIAELDKYRHDEMVMPKVILIHAAQTDTTARAYAGLPFKFTRFDTVFETAPLDMTCKVEPVYTPPVYDGTTRGSSPMDYHAGKDFTPAAIMSNCSSHSGPPEMVPLVPGTSNTNTPPRPNSPTPPAKAAKPKPAVAGPLPAVNGTSEAKTGIAINRHGQRIDLKIREPTGAELDKFERRISHRKLCNEHHLRDNCESYNCKYDHDPIDAVMKNTLRYKARSIPCTQGWKCRRQDCFYGHQCPWGNSKCGNPKCAFIKTGLHDIKDLEIARFVPAQPVT